MARWRLTQKHYLNVPGVEWEYRETDADTGKQARKIFPVPMYLDPDDRGDQNYRDQGLIIVSNKPNPAFPRDIIFIGPPTPDMAPIDEEAEQISASYEGVWKHPIDSLGDEGYGGNVIAELGKLLASAKPSSPIPSNDLAEVKAQIAAMMADHKKLADENARLLSMVEESNRRRV